MEYELRCVYCDVPLVIDERAYLYVCPVCGTVYDSLHVPAYSQLRNALGIMYTESKIRRIIREIEEKYGPLSEVEKKILRTILGKRPYRVDLEKLRKLVKAMKNSVAYQEVVAERARRVYEEIRSFIAKHNLPYSPDDVYELACKYRETWSGKKPSSIATIFVYVYSKLIAKADPPEIPQYIKKTAKVIESYVAEREGCSQGEHQQ